VTAPSVRTPAVASYRLLGVRVDAIDTATFLALVRDAVAAGGRRVVANHNLHSIYLYHRDRRMRDFYALADHVFIDGMPLVLLGRRVGLPLERAHRITSIDWLRPLLRLAATERWRVFFVGSRPGVGEAAAERLRREIPGLELQVAHGYFDAAPESDDNATLLARIATYRPRILLVGMGMPRQEHWIADVFDRLDANVILNLGAVMDFVAGVVPVPPRWLGPLGAEWLFRLASEPRRLWRRYLVEPWALLPLVAREVTTRRAPGRHRTER
jgi:N-acetylglucosaminyldiphosphoundecaprenol N-acetyl-beta-D-mannosaminyltransferase